MKALTLSIVLALVATFSQASLPKVLFYGNVVDGKVTDLIAPEDKVEENYIDGVTITVSCEGEVIREYNNRSTGFFSVILEGGKNYMVTFSKEGYISKRFQLNSEEVVPIDKKSFKMYTDVTLFTKPREGDFSAYEKQPAAKCKYNDKKQRMEWDMDYARMAFNHFVNTVKSLESTAALRED